MHNPIEGLAKGASAKGHMRAQEVEEAAQLACMQGQRVPMCNFSTPLQTLM